MILKSKIYKFYISAHHNQLVEFVLTKIDNEINLPSCKISEYSSRYSTIELYNNYVSFSYDSSSKSFKLSYIIYDSSTTYIALEIS